MFTLNEIAEVTGGQWNHSRTDGEFACQKVASISTDSRTLLTGDLFMPLRGERFDGHDFIEVAVDRKTAAICAQYISDKQQAMLERERIPWLLVRDTLEAYQQIAKSYRSRMKDLEVVAVTGSSGKTTTKELIGGILKLRYGENVLISLRNTNNQVGVPQNLLRLADGHCAAVLELGTNFPGEIGRLTKLVRPNIAVLTNVGPVHLQGLGSVEGVLEEKSAIFETHENHGISGAVVPHRLKSKAALRSKLENRRSVTFGVEHGANFRVRYLGGGLCGSRFEIRSQYSGRTSVISWPVSGAHMALNAGAAFAAASLMGIDEGMIVEGLCECKLPSMRMQIKKHRGILWINDAYNANPDSMRAFVQWLASWQDEEVNRRYLVLGDMLELGGDEDRYHTEVLELAYTLLPDDTIIPVGARMVRAANRYGRESFEDTALLRDWLHDHLREGDAVALKGSRRMALETIMTVIE